MISKNTLFTLIFLFMLFPGQILSCELIKYTDELATLCLLLVVGLDVLHDGWRSVKRLMPLWIILGIGVLYSLYSILFFRFNSPRYIIVDLVSQVKPFVPFAIIYPLGLRLRGWGKQVGRWLCWANVIALLGFFVAGHGQLHLAFGHVVYYGAILFISAFTYLFCSLDDEGRLSVRDLLSVIIMLTLGLLCTRSKYYGEFLIAVTLLLAYRPGIFRHISLKMVLSGLLLFFIVLIAAWGKINYYFIEGATEMLGTSSIDEMSEAFARPLLYYAGGQLLLDFFPFGPGLASFASNASAVSYSTLYYDYGIDKVWGLSPSYNAFICDAYYPTLCQFGIAGVALFIYYWRWLMGTAHGHVTRLGLRYRYPFVIALSMLVFVLIESVGGTLFTQGVGLQAMMLFGIISVVSNESPTE